MSTGGFGKKIAEYQDELLAVRDRRENDIEAVRRRLFSGQVELPVKRRITFSAWTYGFAAAAACGAIVAIALIFGKVTPTPGTFSESTTGKWLNADDAQKKLAFADSSRVLLQIGTSARVLREDGHQVHFLLEKGTADVDVVHYDDTNWVLDCGPYKVNVIGTHFRISWEPQQQIFELQMIEGTVKVTGPMVENGRQITANELFLAHVDEGTFTVKSTLMRNREKLASNELSDRMTAEVVVGSGADSVDDSAASSMVDNERNHHEVSDGGRRNRVSGHTSRHSQKKSSKDENASPVPASPQLSWRELNRAGRFREVVQDARQQGIATVLQTKPVSELMALADAARLQKEWTLARDSYVAIRQRAPQSASAKTAAFSIGRIAFDVQRDFSGASRWLQTYLREAPNGRLAREALGRLMEAQQKTGNMSAAEKSANAYLRKYPTGPHAEVAKSLSPQ